MPWSILDYEGGGITRPGPDHIGFRVESLQAVKERLQTVGEDNPHLRPFPLGAGPEGRARLALFERSPCGAHHLADPRSEEHTSELQSHSDLVCRLLLEKKKK